MMNNSIKLVHPELTLDQHANRIKEAIDKTRSSLFELVDVVKEAYDQLGGEVFGNQLAEKLGMSPSTLSRWKNIGESKVVTLNQSKLPNTFSTLYEIASLEKKYVDQFGEDRGLERLQSIIDRGGISVDSQQSDIKKLSDRIDKTIKAKHKDKREKDILRLVGKSVADEKVDSTLSGFLDKQIVYKNYVVLPPNDLLSKWGKDDVFSSDIAEEFALVDLRAPSQKDFLQCLIVVPAHHVETGLKILSAFGFSYRDMYVPSLDSSDYQNLKHQDIVLRGERGSGSFDQKATLASTSLDDLLVFAEQIGSAPNLLVFDQTNKENWACLSL